MGKTSMILILSSPASCASLATQPFKRGMLVSFGKRSTLLAMIRTRILGFFTSSCARYCRSLKEGPKSKTSTTAKMVASWLSRIKIAIWIPFGAVFTLVQGSISDLLQEHTVTETPPCSCTGLSVSLSSFSNASAVSSAAEALVVGAPP